MSPFRYWEFGGDLAFLENSWKAAVIKVQVPCKAGRNFLVYENLKKDSLQGVSYNLV